MVRRVVNRSSVRCRSIGWKQTAVVAAICIAPFLGCAAQPGATDPGTPPTGDPATGTGGGSNLTCGHSSFPSNATLYQDISTAAVDSQSATIMNALDARNWGDSGKRQTLGIDFSFEVNCAAPSVTRRTYTQTDDTQPDCDLAPVPVPSGGKTEGAGDYACDGGDCHLIVYQGTRLYELYQADITGGAATGGTFTGNCLAIWDLTRDYWSPANHSPDYSRGDACDGGTAADLPIAPMLITTDELNAALAGDGIIHHALRFTIDNNRISSSAYVHPATHYAFSGTTGGTDSLPTGARLRLRGDYKLDGLNAAAQVVARTLQHYGMYLTDGGNIYISATTDAADVIGGSVLGAIRPKDFEMVGGGQRIGRNDYDCNRTPITN
jgi:serine/threonine-protein kinase